MATKEYNQRYYEKNATKLRADARARQWSWSRAKIEIELAKCDLVCANCHRLRTETRAQRPVTVAA